MLQRPQVEPFVEVRVHDPENDWEHTLRTNTAEGQCPEFSQILEFTLKSKQVKFTK